MAQPMFTAVVKGDAQVRRKLDSLGNALARGPIIENALRAAALIAMNAAKQKALVLTGNLRRSIHVAGWGDGFELPTDGDTLPKPPGRNVVAVGTNVIYAKRIEFGFAGADSKGRRYHQPATPFLRPALDENQAEMHREFSEALGDLMRAQLR